MWAKPGKEFFKAAVAANNGTQPQQPKSPARQQCEANEANEYQNTFNAVDNSFYRDAYKSGLKGVLWGGAAGCALTREIGCAEGGLPGAVIGGLGRLARLSQFVLPLVLPQMRLPRPSRFSKGGYF